MNYSSLGNSTNQSDANAQTSGAPMAFLAVIGGVVGLFFLFLVFYMAKLRSHHRQPQRDVEASKSKPKETADLETLNKASPSQKYGAAEGLKRQGSWASTQSNSAEVCAICAICLEVLVDQDDVRRLKCKHVFHASCIDSCFQKHHIDCPLCKSIFIPNRESKVS